MKNNPCAVTAITLCVWLNACVSIAPVNSGFDTARTLKKGERDISFHYSRYYESWDRTAYETNSNIGFRLGTAMGRKSDIKLRYENIRTPYDDPSSWFSRDIHYFSIAPKFGIYRDNMAFSLPAGAYFFDEEPLLFISPSLHFSKRLNAHIDVNYCAKLDIYPGGGVIMNGHQLNIGLSSDLNKWALRPEVGYMTGIPGGEMGRYLTWGLGLVMQFGHPK